MKYTLDTEIIAPLELAARLFDNHDNMKRWQPDITGHELIKGEPRKSGSTARLHYTITGQKLTMKETILVNDLPREFTATYESKGIWNKVTHVFAPTNDGGTMLRSEFEFRISGMMKLVTAVMPNVFRKQSTGYMKNFKRFVEKEARSGHQ